MWLFSFLPEGRGSDTIFEIKTECFFSQFKQSPIFLQKNANKIWVFNNVRFHKFCMNSYFYFSNRKQIRNIFILEMFLIFDTLLGEEGGNWSFSLKRKAIRRGENYRKLTLNFSLFWPCVALECSSLILKWLYTTLWLAQNPQTLMAVEEFHPEIQTIPFLFFSCVLSKKSWVNVNLSDCRLLLRSGKKFIEELRQVRLLERKNLCKQSHAFIFLLIGRGIVVVRASPTEGTSEL